MTMSDIKWTQDQLAAISYPADSSACVTAAAGSGKTALLIGRVENLIRGNENENIPPVPADSFAILTFTRNAAEEFRTRMTQAIEKASRSSGNDRIPREQLIKFRSSFIGTINSFCLGVLKDNPQHFDLPVNFSIVEEGKAAIMLNHALDSTMEYFYSKEFEQDFIGSYTGYGGSLSGSDAQEAGSYAREVLVKSFSFSDDDKLRSAVSSVYSKASSLSDRHGWLDSCARVFSDPKLAEEKFLPEVIAAVPLILNTINRCITKADLAFADIENEDMYAALEEKIEPVREYAEKVSELCNKYLLSSEKISFSAFDKLHEELDVLPVPVVITTGLPRAKGDDTPRKAAVLDALTQASSAFAELKLETGYGSESFKSEMKQQLYALTALVMLVRRLENEFTALKRKSGVVDFADCEQLLLAELRKKDSVLRNSLSERYRCIIIDEFQDTNDLQYEIFRTISRNQSNLFFVGDIKQSIYAFRGGNPEIMAECISDGSGYKKLPLNQNFRSRKNVIDTVNAMFDGLMTAKYGDVDYSDNNQLVPGAVFPDASQDYSSELHILDFPSKAKSSKAAEAEAAASFLNDEINVPESEKLPNAAISEARYTAALIRKMAAEKFMVKGAGGIARPCTWGDFAILLRSNSHVKDYKAELEKLGIPVATSGGDYLAADEINLIISYLKLIDNPQLDEQAINVLMSPLYSFTANELALAKLGILGYDRQALDNSGIDLTSIYEKYSGLSLFSCIMDASGQNNDKLYAGGKLPELQKQLADSGITRKPHPRCTLFAEHFNDFRQFAAGNSIERLIRHVYDSTDFFSVISTYERSDRKLANIRLLLKYTADFEKSGGGTLNEFLRYTDAIRANSGTLQEAVVAQEAADAVKIMTFHASKGLQWPIVILGQLGTKQHDEKTNQIIIDRKTGIGLKNTFIEQRQRAFTLGFNAAKLSVKRQQKGEELRLLYVAMTRAEEKLIMIGNYSLKNCPEWKNESFTPEYGLSGNKLIEWIIASMYRYSGDAENPIKIAGPDIKIITCTERPDDPDSEVPENEDISDLSQTDSNIDEQTAQFISRQVQQQYPYIYDTTLQSRFSVTELAHRNDESKEATLTLSKPAFLSAVTSGIKITGILIGNTYHHIMELFPLETLHADYSPEDMEAAVENGINELIENAMLNPDECYAAENRKEIFVKKTTNFFLGKIGQEMLTAQHIEREYEIFAELNTAEILNDNNADPDSSTILQGRIDMLYVKDDRVVIVDYKSDSRSSMEEELDSYCQQVKLYRTILPLLKECSGRTIELYLYSFQQDKAINVEQEQEQK